MEKLGMAPDETIQLNELLTLKNLCLTKSITMSPLVSDEELKGILKQDSATTEQHIRELKSLIEKSEIAVTDNQ
jgi:similar to spore coat protein